jgi:hypothetical protein
MVFLAILYLSNSFRINEIIKIEGVPQLGFYHSVGLCYVLGKRNEKFSQNETKECVLIFLQPVKNVETSQKDNNQGTEFSHLPVKCRG